MDFLYNFIPVTLINGGAAVGQPSRVEQIPLANETTRTPALAESRALLERPRAGPESRVSRTGTSSVLTFLHGAVPTPTIKPATTVVTTPAIPVPRTDQVPIPGIAIAARISAAPILKPAGPLVPQAIATADAEYQRPLYRASEAAIPSPPQRASDT